MRSFKSILLRISVVFILCIAVVLSSTIMPIAAGLAGDVNADDTLTAEDLTIVRKSLLNGETNTEYDINGDGKVDIRDLVNLKKKIAHYVDGEKFTANTVTEIGNAAAVKITELFAAKDGANIDSSLVVIDVNAGETGVTYEISADTENWENSTILFKGTGEVTVSIREYSKTTSIKVNVVNVDKFAPVTDVSVQNDESLLLGQLFTLIDGVTVDSSKVKVNVVNCEYSANTEDWKNSIVTFKNVGTATVTIEEESNPATTTVTVTQRPNTDKFQIKFPNTEKYLYRVGNGNAVALDSLFSAIEGTEIEDKDVAVTVTAIEGENVSGTFSENDEDWTKGTIQFSGTGVVKVIISDNFYCNELELLLEVVDAKNTTIATSATANNVVLLNDISGSFSVSGGYTFYGNGFEITLPKSTVTNKGNGFVGFINLSDGHLDNLRVIGPVFPEQYIYRNQAEITNSSDPDYGDGYNMRYFHNSVIVNSGSCNITNCYVSGSRTAICVKDGEDVVIEDTTVSGGSYANIQVIAADSVVFRNIITEQIVVKDSYNAEGSKKDIIGLGIVIDDKETEIYFEGTLHQYNWINQTQWNNLLGSYVNQFPKFFSDSTYSTYWHYREGDSTTKYVNLTCIFACEWNSKKLHDNRSDKTISYKSLGITVATMDGGVYSVSNAGTLTDALYYAPVYAPSAQFAVAPDFEFDYFTKENYVAATEGSNVYCYEDSGVVKISFDEGSNKVWNTSILTVTKGNETVPYTVKMNGTDYTNASITFTTAGNYTIVYTYTDPYNYKLDENGSIVSYDKTYTKQVNITVSVVESAAKNAEFKMGTNSQAVEKKLINNNVYLSASGISDSGMTSGSGLKFPRKEGDTSTISFKFSGKTTGSWACATIDGETFYFPVVAMTTTDGTFKHTGGWYGCFPVFEGAITITDYADGGTGNAVTYNGSTTTLPATMKALYPQTVFRYQGTSSQVPTTPSKITKGPSNGKLCYTTQTNLSASNTRGEEWNLATYTYVDNKGTTYYWYVAYYCQASTNGGCVTPDTLVTLADGSKVRVDSLTGNEELLVWNHETGTLDKAPVAYIVNHDKKVEEKEILHLYFSNGDEIRIIGEHVFFDATLGKYVAIDLSNVEQYIGHKFVGLGDELMQIELVKADKYTEVTSAYEVVSYKHLTCFTNNILSTSAYLDKLLNIFDIDLSTMTYTAEKVQQDIETYGLYTYADFEGLISEEAFELYNAQYLKIAVGKGYITWDDILDLIDIYFNVDVKPIN